MSSVILRRLECLQNIVESEEPSLMELNCSEINKISMLDLTTNYAISAHHN
jgi:hypothetical protein